MSLYLTSASLYEFYQSAAGGAPANADGLASLPRHHVPGILPADMVFLERMYGIRPLYYAAVPDQEGRRKSRLIQTRVQSPNLPSNLYFSISKDVFAAVPEVCMLQLACCLPVEELVMAYYEFFGRYRLNNDGSFGYSVREPLSTRERAVRFAQASHGARGSENMLRALAMMADGQPASPPEAQIACFFSAGCKLGGAGFSGAVLNHPIETEKGLRYGDLCWPKERLVIEYDSNEAHSGSDKINKDAMRRNLIMGAGWKVLTVTSQQLASLAKMRELIPTVALNLGRANRPRVKEYLRKQARLYKAATEQMPHDEVALLLRSKRIRAVSQGKDAKKLERPQSGALGQKGENRATAKPKRRE